MASMEPILPAISQEKNRKKQRKYKNGLKHKGLRRISLVVKAETLNRIKEISAHSGISQGEVINRMFDIERIKEVNIMEEHLSQQINSNNIIELPTANRDPLRFEDFSSLELAIDTMARMLGKNLHELLAERRKRFPDKAKLEELELRRTVLLAEQRHVYFGDTELRQRVIKEYCPLV